MDVAAAIKSRISVRKYSERKLGQKEKDQIYKVIDELIPLYPDIPTRFIFIEDETVTNEQVMTGLIGGYGKIKAPYCILCATVSREGAYENIGFMGEQLALHLTSMGIGSCWIGGGFDKDKTHQLVGEGWIVPTVLSLGFPHPSIHLLPVNAKENRRRRKQLRSIAYDSYYGNDISTFLGKNPSYENVLDMCRLAPSAMNFQPGRVILTKEKAIFLSAANFFMRKNSIHKIDGGIMFTHFVTMMEAVGKKGEIVIEDVEKVLQQYKVPKGHSYVASYKLK